jgi:pimeloyl-ACP methyl ester carboxylesterase
MLHMITSSLLFKPPVRQPLCKFREDSKNRLIRSVQGDDIHCHLVCPWDKDTSINDYSGTKNILFFLHGNSEDVASGNSYCQWLADKTQSNVVTCDYPGYGFSTGEPTEDGMDSAAFAVLDFALCKLRHKMHEIIIIGKSIGSTPAISLASQAGCSDLGGVVLIAPVASGVRCFSASSSLPTFILTNMDTWVLPNITRISNVACPVQFVHGLEDNVVPIANSRMLIAAMRSPPLTDPLWVNAGHNDIESRCSNLFTNTLADFIEVCSQRSLCKSRYDTDDSTNENMAMFDL